MTFTNFAQAQWGQALADLRDQIAAETTGWTIESDDAAGGALALGDKFIIGTPASDSAASEYISFELDATYGGVIIRHGTSFATGSIDTRWDFDPANVGKLHSDSNGNVETTVFPKSSLNTTTPNTIDPSESGSYWAVTTARGFGFYFQREEADGDDGDCFIGFSEVNKAWNYHNADRDESEWVIGLADSAGGGQDIIHMSNSGFYDDNNDPQHSKGNNDYGSRGNVNPDTDFDNYPVTNNVISSRTWRNIGQEDLVLGTFDLWGEDRSESDTGHRDLIVDSNDNPVFTVLKRSGTPNIILRQA